MAGCRNWSTTFDLNGPNRLAEISSNKCLSLRETADTKSGYYCATPPNTRVAHTFRSVECMRQFGKFARFRGQEKISPWNKAKVLRSMMKCLPQAIQGRFVVVELEGITASLQLFGDDTRNGGRIYFEKTISVPASTLTVIGKNHKRPSTYRVCR